MAHFVDFLEILGEERHSAGLQRKGLEGAFESLGIAFFAEDADGVDGRPIIVLNGANGLFERFAALVVISIGDYQQYFLLTLGALGQVLG